MEWLLDSIHRMTNQGKVLIFCNHIKTCNDLDNIMKEFAPDVDKVVIHGDKIQQERSTIIKKFKKDARLMIATDVASRGLDIPEIRFVVNYENPKDWETYVHRIGRTGRAGNKDGVAITLILRSEAKFASKMARQFDSLGLVVPPDLHDLAMSDQKYQELTWKNKMGFKGDKNNQSSQMLEQALNAGQKTKQGLGFRQEPKSRSKKNHQESYRHQGRDQQSRGGLKSDLHTLNDEMRSLVDEVVSSEYRIQQNHEYSKGWEQFVVEKKVSRFTDHGEAPQIQKIERKLVSAAELERMKLEEKIQQKKQGLKTKFLSAFQKKGTLDVNRPEQE